MHDVLEGGGVATVDVQSPGVSVFDEDAAPFLPRGSCLFESPRGPMYILANLAVGGDWPGAPDATTQFPATFDIDYIRAYRFAP